jgi:putative ABC transport system substrate-binding protein
MRRRDVLILLGGAAIAWSLAAFAQQTGKVARIGVLDYASASSVQHLWQAFRQRLRELGYVEGKTIAFESRWAGGKIERLPELAAELVRLRVDIIVAASAPAALAAKDATKTIPIVFFAAGDALDAGLVTSLPRPGGNITGVSTGVTGGFGGKRLELLKELVPGGSRFVLLWDQPNPYSRLIAQETEAAAQALRVSLQTVGVRGPDELDAAFSAMRRERVGGLVVTPSSMLFGERKRLADLALENRLPTVFPVRGFAEVGGLMSYGANLSDDARRAAVYVAKILKGAKPADLPVDQATKFELVINLRTAKALGLTIPPTVLARADEVIE